jgi:tRNA pseudouridine13 synthase
LNALPLAWGPPPASGRIRVEPEDFQVEEVLGFAPDGTGSHVLLLVEKRGANSGWVAARLAHAAGVPVRDVGFSGHKDRAALTRQYYSMPLRAGADATGWTGFSGEGFRVLEAQAHGRKLRAGTHRANRFRIGIRELEGDADAIAARLACIARGGVPNYFGPQRFGRSGANLYRARDWAAGRPEPRERATRSFALSAARSELFNSVLGRRVERGDWNRLLPGEAAMLDGRRSYFRVDTIDAALIERCDLQDVHPSGPLHGRGDSPVGDAVAALEREVLATEPALAALLEAQGMEHERRSLRVPLRAFEWRLRASRLELAFELPRGAFATALLHELLRDAWDESEPAED